MTLMCVRPLFYNFQGVSMKHIPGLMTLSLHGGSAGKENRAVILPFFYDLKKRRAS